MNPDSQSLPTWKVATAATLYSAAFAGMVFGGPGSLWRASGLLCCILLRSWVSRTGRALIKWDMGLVFIGMFILMLVAGIFALLGDHIPTPSERTLQFIYAVMWLSMMVDLVRQWRQPHTQQLTANPTQ